jgi:hypothetical protein
VAFSSRKSHLSRRQKVYMYSENALVFVFVAATASCQFHPRAWGISPERLARFQKAAATSRRGLDTRYSRQRYTGFGIGVGELMLKSTVFFSGSPASDLCLLG